MLKKQLEQLNKKLEKYEKVEEDQPVVIKPRAFTRNKDGGYAVDGNIYETLIGSRTNVFEGKSYKTTGGLKKTDLIINKYGKILSKNKSISGKINNRLEKVNQAKMTKLAEPEVKKELSTYSLI